MTSNSVRRTITSDHQHYLQGQGTASTTTRSSHHVLETVTQVDERQTRSTSTTTTTTRPRTRTTTPARAQSQRNHNTNTTTTTTTTTTRPTTTVDTAGHDRRLRRVRGQSSSQRSAGGHVRSATLTAGGNWKLRYRDFVPATASAAPGTGKTAVDNFQ